MVTGAQAAPRCLLELAKPAGVTPEPPQPRPLHAIASGAGTGGPSFGSEAMCCCWSVRYESAERDRRLVCFEPIATDLGARNQAENVTIKLSVGPLRLVVCRLLSR